MSSSPSPRPDGGGAGAPSASGRTGSSRGGGRTGGRGGGRGGGGRGGPRGPGRGSSAAASDGEGGGRVADGRGRGEGSSSAHRGGGRGGGASSSAGRTGAGRGDKGSGSHAVGTKDRPNLSSGDANASDPKSKNDSKPAPPAPPATSSLAAAVSATPAGRRGKGGRSGRGSSADAGRSNRESQHPGSQHASKQNRNDNWASKVSSEALQKQEEEAKRKQEIEEEAKRKKEIEEAEARVAAEAEAKKRREAEELAARAKESRDALKSFLDSAAKRWAYRSALRPDALEASRKSFEAGKKSLKTDLKKCTTFVKKVKTGSVWSAKVEDTLKDVGTLNLSRYVEEVAKGVLESKPKVTDLPAIVALCVAMHERYGDFLPALLPPVTDVVQGRGDAEAAKSKRLCLRLLTEFLLVGLVTETKTLLKCVAEATGAGRDAGGSDAYAVQDGNMVVAFCKAAGFEVFGTTPRSIQRAAQFFRSEKEKLDASTSILLSTPDEGIVTQGYSLSMEVESAVRELVVSAEVSELFTKHCRGAYRFLAASLVQTHGKLQKLERRCEQDRLLSGTLPEAREAGLADARRLKENLQKSVEALSDVLNEDAPVLPDDTGVMGHEAGAGVEVWTKGAGEEDDFGPFDDEETRAFYFDVPDLIATIPPALLGLTPDQVQKRKEDNLKKYGRDGEGDAEMNLADDSLEVTPATEAELDANESGQKLDDMIGDDDNVDDFDDKSTPRYKLVALLEEELPECNRREQVDELMERFCTNFGSNKNARRRLSKALFLVPRNRFDLMPYYSRVAAIADRVWPEVASPLVTDLEQQFHGQAKFKKNQNLDSRFKTARYIGELTKFRVAPPIVFLRCIRRCLDDFTGGNVEVACCLLETCGRFLYRLKHTSSRIVDIMEAMTRLTKAKNLDERSQSLVKSAFYNVKPPQGVRRKVKEYPPLESYLRGLLIDRLVPTPSFVSFAAKQITRLPWSNPVEQCGPLLTRLMLKACRRGRYRTINAIASIAARLRSQRTAGEVSVRLIDAVLEELRWALENPNFRDQQRVVTYARLLGELYGTNQVSGHLLIRQLYDFINLGHEIPDALREASKKFSSDASDTADLVATNLPVYNSATGVSKTILEDEEMDDDALVTTEESTAPEPPKPVAVSEHSKYDPRVPAHTDPPNSAYRVKLVCTLLEVAAPTVVTRSNLPRLKGFLTAFQRYLFTKSILPTDVEFVLLDTFDILDSHWKQVSKSKKADESEEGFPRFATWLDAHNATVSDEESEAQLIIRRAEVDASDVKSSTYSVDGRSARDDDDTMTNFDEEDADEDEDSLQSDFDSEDGNDEENENQSLDAAGEMEVDIVEPHSTVDDDGEATSGDDEEGSSESEYESEGEDEEEFDEEAYMRKLEEEAFERELRRMTLDALERGKNASRKLVADSMPSGSQISKKKGPDPTPSESLAPPPLMLALSGKEGVSFQVLKKGNKGKMETRDLIVPKDTNLAVAATRQGDEAARERHAIKQRVLQYEADSAYAEESGGNVYLEQEKLQVIRNRPLSLEDIDRNFGTTSGNLRQGPQEKAPATQSISTGGSSASAPVGGRRPGRGRDGAAGRGRGRGSSGRTLYR